MDTQSIDRLVLGTVNASWKRALSANMLAKKISQAEVEDWLSHIATFFIEVNPRLVLDFARVHGISANALFNSYQKVKTLTGEANGGLEAAFDKLGQAA